MESVNRFAEPKGAGFYDIFESADATNAPIDDELAKYLDNNSSGIEFLHNGKNYRLSKDQGTGNYVLHQQRGSDYVLKDPDVQMNSKYAPEGFVEIGGLGAAGTRVFIGRSPDNPEQVVKLDATHDIGVDSHRDLFKTENVAILYDGSKGQATEEPATTVGAGEQDEFSNVFNAWAGASEQPAASTEQPAAGKEKPTAGTEQTAVEDVAAGSPGSIDESARIPEVLPLGDRPLFPNQLPLDGQFEAKSDGYWYNNAGLAVALFPGNDLVGVQVNDGEVSRKLTSADGSLVFVPADPVTGDYLMGSTFKDSSGKETELSFELLQQNNVPVSQISMAFVNPQTELDGKFSVVNVEGTNLVANADGKVIGLSYNDELGDYIAEPSKGGVTVYREFIDPSNGESLFISANAYDGTYEVTGKDVLDGEGKPVKNEDGSQMKASMNRFELLGLLA